MRKLSFRVLKKAKLFYPRSYDYECMSEWIKRKSVSGTKSKFVSKFKSYNQSHNLFSFFLASFSQVTTSRDFYDIS